MRKRNLPSNKSTQKNKRENGDAIPWRYCLMTLICGLFLVVGFFFAARQHFSAMDYGMKNSKLRRQIDELESEKRRLILEKEVALSPAEIKKAAKKIGLTAMTASNIEVYRNVPQTSGKPQAEKISATKPSEKTAEKTEPEAEPVKLVSNKSDNKTTKSEKSPKPEKKPSEAKKPAEAKEKAQNKAAK